MALILSIDTSTYGCSVALHDDAKRLACYELMTEKSSSAMLTLLIQNVVAQTGFRLADLDAVAVAKGPGSYTGLRIGVSTAKGLCFALDKPLVAVNTLLAMAAQIRHFFPDTHLLCPMIDARRMEVYCAVFDNNLQEITPVEAKVIDQGAFSDVLGQRPVVFFGDGASKCQVALGEYSNALFLPETVFPSAKTVGLLAAQGFENRQFEDLATFEPFYLKDFVTTSPKKKMTVSA